MSAAAIIEEKGSVALGGRKRVGLIGRAQLGSNEAREERTIRKSLVGGKQAAVVWTEDLGSAAGLKGESGASIERTSSRRERRVGRCVTTTYQETHAPRAKCAVF